MIYSEALKTVIKNLYEFRGEIDYEREKIIWKD
jgi:hypothetical protein